MLKYTMILMLQAGRNATKIGKKNRKLMTSESESDSGDEFGHVSDDGPSARRPKVKFFRVYKQGVHFAKKVFLPFIPRKTKHNETERNEIIGTRKAIVDKFKEIRFRGVAKASWGWAMWLVAGTQGANPILKRAVRIGENWELERARKKTVDMTKMLNGMAPYIEVTNKLGWIRRIVPDIEQRMMSSADARLRHELERIFQRGIDRAQRQAGAA
jgi:hypothetical protein